jgi:hypothetical protein
LPAAANTIRRKRAVFHGALGYAVELGLLTVNPMGKVRWHAPGAAVALNPATVASPAQVRAILAQVVRARPDLAAFSGCLYYAALRPEEAVALRRKDLIVPAHGRGNDYRGGRQAALGPELAATALARRPYDLRHAALSLWLNASGAPAEVAAGAGNSPRVLHDIYLHCIDSRDDLVSQRTEDALQTGQTRTNPSRCATASGYTHRRLRPGPCPLSVREPRPEPAHSPRPPGPQHRTQACAATSVSAAQTACAALSAEAGRCPDLAHA